jgi:preprotein translocase subunit SecA
MLEFITKSFAKVFGTKSERDIKAIRAYVDAIHAETPKLTGLSDDQLRGQTVELQKFIQDKLSATTNAIDELRLRLAEDADMELSEKEASFSKIDKLEKERLTQLEGVLMQILPRAFAVVKETARRWKENKQLVVTVNDLDRELAARRAGITIEGDKAIWHNKWMAAGSEITWEMLHYDVQLIGGIVLHQGKISEMATGEGKTLVATLPAYLNGLAGFGVHIVTVNDYLAKRDSEWMGPLFEFHGLRVDCIDKHEPNSLRRRIAYAADIIYGTNNEFGFDYLRDNMVRTPNELVQRDHHYAMVDEVDSVLVDDARTPLIISGPVATSGEEQEFYELKPFIAKLVDEQRKLVNSLLAEARQKIGTAQEDDGALALFRAYRGLPKNKPLIKYLSETGIKQKMQKVENFYLQDNGKAMPEADKVLFFTIEEKHNSIELTEQGLAFLANLTGDNSFFVMPDIGAGIAEIKNNRSLTEEEKLVAQERLNDDFIVKSRRIHTMKQLLKAYTLFEKDVEYIIVEDKVKIVDEQTGRVMEGRRYSDGLHQALEAKENVRVEEMTQTYATITLQNYFRMYHKLAGMTGTAETEATEFWEIYKLDVVTIPTNRPVSRKDYEDKVYKTTREKFNAVVEEIQQLTGQGRPVLVGTTSVEISEVLSRLLQMRKIPHQVLNAKQHAKEAEIVAEAGKPGTVTIATNMAGRGTDIKLTPESKAAGGLAIIGTERHESRRVDRQLRGRAGRQGDPGTSQFFVSLEDSLMRLFGSDRIARAMDRLGLEEGEVIQHSMITKSIERAQKKVEENNFGTRKRLLEYDNVMNSQREVIYRRRHNALFGERLGLDIMNMFYDIASDIVESNKANYANFKLRAHTLLGVTTEITEQEFDSGKSEALIDRLYHEAHTHYNRKNTELAQAAYPLLEQIRLTHGQFVQFIGVVFTDGRRMLNIEVNLERACATQGMELVTVMEQTVVLGFIDQMWKEHLRDMDDLRQEVMFATLEQKDPLMIYKFEGFELFKNFIGSLNEDVVSFLSKATLRKQEEVMQEAQDAQTPVAPQIETQARPQQPPVRRQKLVETKQEVPPVDASAEVAELEKDHQLPPVQKSVSVTRPITAAKTPNRNDKVNVQYADGTVKKDVKYKTVEEDLKNNRCVLI